MPARLAPEAVSRVLDHYLAERADGETFRQYVLRHKVETFRALTRDLAKPAELYPEIYQDWGDDPGVFAAAWPRRVRRVAAPVGQTIVFRGLPIWPACAGRPQKAMVCPTALRHESRYSKAS